MSSTDPDPDPDANYYEILGVTQDATDDAIIAAYREKIKKHHPDLSDAENAQEMTQLINEAKAVLTDSKKRSRYDRRRTRDQDTSTRSEKTETEADPHRTNQNRNHRTNQNRNHRTNQNRNHRTNQNRNHRKERRQSRTRTRSRTGSRTADEDADDDSDQTESRTETNDSRQSYIGAVFATFWEVYYTIDQWLSHPAKRFAPFRHFFSPPSFRAVIGEPRRWLLAPTSIRLLIAACFAVPVLIWLDRTLGSLSLSQGLAVVVAAVVLSHAGYGWLGPFSFEPREPRSKPSFNPGMTAPVYPMVIANLAGFTLVLIGYLTGAPFGGLGWMFSAIVGLVIFSLFLTPICVFLGVCLEAIRTHKRLLRGAGLGMKFTPVFVFLFAFTTWGWNVNLSDAITDSSQAPETVWIPQVLVGPLEVGTLVTFLIGMVMLGCLLASVLYMGRFFARAPSWDRYQHGYSIRPGVWNLIVTLPVAIIGWATISNVDVAVVFLGGLLVLPVPLASAYELRRWLEPWI
ncbi:DnaJ domain-containing protein [Saliphagus infecundisoli]|uniref:DnaJ domain-containing protein n=1 Tax=Saliphagus infecundisoli TaxID=1849069 RepID=A0ABD5Q965_9EURY|nr:DnaJ domain-containing protein [Saliphagus infecundisoli]